jgi:hypothetical protein
VVLAEKNSGGLPTAIIRFELKLKAMGGFLVAHGLFYFFFSRLNSKKAMADIHSLFCLRGGGKSNKA